MPLLQLSIYASLLILVIGVVFKTIRIARMPVHLRWDLYPIPHEKGKAHYGGSRHEESDWWTRPLRTSRFAELIEMAKEIFAIKTLHRHNRGLWYASMPFHWGLYALTAFLGLLLVDAFIEIVGANSAPGIARQSLHTLIIAAGVSGWTLGLTGVAALLLIRTLTAKYRSVTLFSDYFNLALLLSLFAAGFAAWITVDRSFVLHRAFALRLITFSPIDRLPILMAIELGLVAFFFAYLPFTHMTHFVGKFFTFHRVRWQDEPNTPGGKLEREVTKALGRRMKWSAPHIGAGKTWADSAADRDRGEG